jgi:hypothetical protein
MIRMGAWRPTAAVHVGDRVIYRGRRYVVVGFTPTAVRPFRVELRDVETKERRWFAWPLPPESDDPASRAVDPPAGGR